MLTCLPNCSAASLAGHVLPQVNQQFPPGDSLAQQHAIRLVQAGEPKEQPLQTAMGNSYPIIIRLEALSEQATADGKQLQQVRCLCARAGVGLRPCSQLRAWVPMVSAQEASPPAGCRTCGYF
jgi:hypothetical protein